MVNDTVRYKSDQELAEAFVRDGYVALDSFLQCDNPRDREIYLHRVLRDGMEARMLEQRGNVQRPDGSDELCFLLLGIVHNPQTSDSAILKIRKEFDECSHLVG